MVFTLVLSKLASLVFGHDDGSNFGQQASNDVVCSNDDGSNSNNQQICIYLSSLHLSVGQLFGTDPRPREVMGLIPTRTTSFLWWDFTSTEVFRPEEGIEMHLLTTITKIQRACLCKLQCYSLRIFVLVFQSKCSQRRALSSHIRVMCLLEVCSNLWKMNHNLKAIHCGAP